MELTQRQFIPTPESADDFTYFRKSIEISEGRRLEFLSGAPANLLFHTLNVYGLLHGHGESYSKVNTDIGDALDEQIKKYLAKNINDKLIVEIFLKFDPKTPEELINIFLNDEEYGDPAFKVFGQALEKSWALYKNYWEKHAPIFKRKIEENVANVKYREWAEKMEFVVGERFDMDFVAIVAEPLMESAMYLEPNVTMGTITRRGDSGFVHEGLHLLLKEKWAEESRILNMVPNNWHDKGWGKFWQKKFEQAIVVSLDCLIRGREDVAEYMEGCNVGDLEQFFFEPIKKWYELKLKGETQETLPDVIYEILRKNRKELMGGGGFWRSILKRI